MREVRHTVCIPLLAEQVEAAKVMTATHTVLHILQARSW